jgi:hypothetical protein
MAVPPPGLREKLEGSIGSNGSTSSGISRKSRRRSTGYADHAGNRAALLSDLREYLQERWPCLIGYFNVEVAKYEATSNAENQG